MDVDLCLLTGAFEMGDPFDSHPLILMAKLLGILTMKKSVAITEFLQVEQQELVTGRLAPEKLWTQDER